MIIRDLFHLVYPKTCCICGTNLSSSEQHICFLCDLELPLTRYWNQPGNPMFHALNARACVSHASALLFFQRGNSTQQLLHRLKYRGDREMGKMLGAKLGNVLKEVAALQDLDLMIPVPLHRSKLLQRGYNQSLMIAQGISQTLSIEIQSNTLKRNSATRSQTKKGRFERWEGIKSTFDLLKHTDIRNKHILLVDDVFTTGATLEACILALQNGNPRKISVVTAACSD